MRRAVVLTTSVKTLPVAVTVLMGLAPSMGPAAGAAVVPAMMAHLGQIVISSLVVARWQGQERRAAKAA